MQLFALFPPLYRFGLVELYRYARACASGLTEESTIGAARTLQEGECISPVLSTYPSSARTHNPLQMVTADCHISADRWSIRLT